MISNYKNKSLDITSLASIATNVLPSELAVASNGQYVASIYSLPTQLGIWKLPEFSRTTERLCTSKPVDYTQLRTPPLLLLEHKRPIKVIALSKHVSSFWQKGRNVQELPTKTGLLCSVNKQCVMIWNLDYILEQQVQNQTKESSPVTTTNTCFVNSENCVLYAGDIIPSYSEISYCVFSWHNEYIAVCLDSDILVIFIGADVEGSSRNQPVWLTDTERQCQILKAHKCCVNAIEFHHRNVNVLISISDDSSYIVWDLCSVRVLYRGHLPYLMAVPIVLGLNWEKDTAIVGTSNGHLVVINLSLPDATSNKSEKDSLFKIIQSVDCSEIVRKMHTSCVDQSVAVDSGGLSSISVESNCLVLSLCYLPQEKYLLQPKYRQRTHNKSLFTNSDMDYERLIESPLMVVGTNNAVLCLNVYTLECLASVDLKIYNSELLGDLNTLSLMLPVETEDDILLLTANSFSSNLNISRMQSNFETFNEVSNDDSLLLKCLLDGDDQQKLSDDISSRKYIIYPCTLLTETSVLKSQLVPVGKIKKTQKTKSKPKARTDHQVTFTNKVKSSGYSTSPTHQTMFTPKTNNFQTKSKPLPKKSHFKTKMIQENFDPEKITDYKTSLQISDNSAAITCIRISPSGSKLAVGSINSSVVVLKQPLVNNTTSYLGHSKSVNSVDWSYNSKWLVTTSDESAAVWEMDKPVPLMKFTKIKSNFSCDKQTSCFTKDIKKAQFYYMDNFILLAASDSFHLYKYHLDSTKEDMQRYITKSKYKSVGTYQTDGNCITDLTAINAFYSYVVLCCTTNRSVSVYDMNVGQIIQLITNVHPTVPYCLAMNSGSSYLSLPPNAYDLVLSAALTDSVKLWDLRSGQCVRKLEQHCNRAYTCRAVFSPCGQYVLAGSEDYTAYLYDVREGRCCTRLTRHSDVVTDVAYHPFIPQLTTATLNGQLYTFTCQNL
ncbi:WD repeat-containing protein 27-like [Octopus sinensis]|uniref:WD repeat-containing protein 27-like n=1 Tax=Octopus sinensis TaxID=2607531 RepID=A0A6P7SZD2_9MOLL|nr:WD repeat-containing protein 27-like [Octopus sinensis]